MPRVTVIIATYNRSNVLRYAIASVLRQTMTDFELLVVGDACTDDSEEVVRSFADPRVRWINLPENTGHQSGPNNEGLRQARGTYIAYLGHDDLWLPHHLEVMTRALDETHAARAYSILACHPERSEGPRSEGPGGAGGAVPRDSDAPHPPRSLATLGMTPSPAWGYPSSTVHHRDLTAALGGWKHYKDVEIEPDADLWRRAKAAGFASISVPRLGGIKFPASVRRNVYRERPDHEQAEWLARIEAEPDLEATLLAEMLTDARDARRMPYRVLLRTVWSETLARLRHRLAERSKFAGVFWRRKGGGLDAVRKFKGLEEKN